MSTDNLDLSRGVKLPYRIHQKAFFIDTTGSSVYSALHIRRSGGTGRRAGLKIQWGQPRESSILSSGTIPQCLSLKKTNTKTVWISIGSRRKYGPGLFPEKKFHFPIFLMTISAIGKFIPGNQPYTYPFSLTRCSVFKAQHHPLFVPYAFDTDPVRILGDEKTGQSSQSLFVLQQFFG